MELRGYESWLLMPELIPSNIRPTLPRFVLENSDIAIPLIKNSMAQQRATLSGSASQRTEDVMPFDAISDLGLEQNYTEYRLYHQVSNIGS